MNVMIALGSGIISSDQLREVLLHMKHWRLASRPFTGEGSCLLVIDMQQFFINPVSHAAFPAAEVIIKNVQSLLEAYRNRALPVVFTRHALQPGESPGIMGEWWGDILRVDDPLSEIDNRVAPWEGETVVRKTRYSAFVGTELGSLLENLGVRRVVVVGVQTHLCCESTARDAFMRDYEVFFVADATAANNQTLHIGSLRALANGFAILTTTWEVIGWLQEGK